jgi:hypothetical protein
VLYFHDQTVSGKTPSTDIVAPYKGDFPCELFTASAPFLAAEYFLAANVVPRFAGVLALTALCVRIDQRREEASNEIRRSARIARSACRTRRSSRHAQPSQIVRHRAVSGVKKKTASVTAEPPRSFNQQGTP